jgi:hypothetical protein
LCQHRQVKAKNCNTFCVAPSSQASHRYIIQAECEYPTIRLSRSRLICWRKRDGVETRKKTTLNRRMLRVPHADSQKKGKKGLQNAASLVCL